MPSVESTSAAEHRPSGRSRRVWSLAIRLFHWGLVACVVLSFLTMKVETDLFDFPQNVHARAGLIALGLVLFRWGWALVGDYHARIGSWLRSPSVTLAYARDLMKRRADIFAGHNPLGGWAVLAMLTSLTIQALTGLFVTDDIFFEAPLHTLVPAAVSDTALWIHHLNANVLLALIVLHLGALLAHRCLGERLVGAMFSGRKTLPRGAHWAETDTETHQQPEQQSDQESDRASDHQQGQRGSSGKGVEPGRSALMVRAALLALFSTGCVMWLWGRL